MSDLPDRRQNRNALLVNAVTRPVNLLAALATFVVVGAVAGAAGLAAGLVVLAIMAIRTFFDADEADRVFAARRAKRQAAGAGGAGPAGAPAGAPPRRGLAGRRQPAPLPPPPRRVDPSTLPEQFAVHLRSAHRTEQSVKDALAQTGTEFTGLTEELALLVDDMEKTAARAHMVDTYLRSQQPAALQAELNALRASAGSQTRIDQLNDQLKSLYRLQRKVEDYVAQLSTLTGALSTVATKVVELALIGDESRSNDLLAQARGLREQVEELQDILRDPAL